MCLVIRALPSLKCSGLPGADPNEQLESSCFVDAVVAFCKLQHLDFSISVKKQVSSFHSA
jgi:calcineurin-binding protein cabin-1